VARAVPAAYWAAARTILQGLGIRPTAVNLKLLVSYFIRERGWTNALATNNPTDSTAAVPGSYLLPGNGAGVRVYPTLAIGLQADVATLRLGYYAPLRAALRDSSPAQWFGATTAWSYALCGHPGCSDPTTPAYLAEMRAIYDQLPTPPGAFLKPGGGAGPVPDPLLLSLLAVAGIALLLEVI